MGEHVPPSSGPRATLRAVNIRGGLGGAVRAMRINQATLRGWAEGRQDHISRLHWRWRLQTSCRQRNDDDEDVSVSHNYNDDHTLGAWTT